MDFTSLTLSMVAVAAAGFVRGFVGFGAALMTVPIFALLYGPQAAVPISTVIGIGSAILLLPTAVRESEPSVVLPIAAGVFIAAPLGAWILVSIDADLMRVAISLLVVIMVVALARGGQWFRPVSNGALLGAGVAGGLVQGAAGVGGPPVVAVALSRPGPPRIQRANVIGVMTAVAVSAIIPLAWLRLYTPEVLIIGGILLPINSVATWLGAKHFNRGGHRYFRRAAIGLLASIGVVTLVVAARDFMQRI